VNSPRTRSAVFLPLSSQADDPATVTWCRGVPLLLAEELRALKASNATFAAWTSGRGATLQMVHLQESPPVGHVAAYARAAEVDLGISGWGSFLGDPFMKLAVVTPDAQNPRKILVDCPPGSSCVQLVRAAFKAVCTILGLPNNAVPPLATATDSDEALLAWLQDLEHQWFLRRRGQEPSPADGCRELLSALTHDPDFEPAARALLRRCGAALSASVEQHGEAEVRRIQNVCSANLLQMLRLRPKDFLGWTLLGMLQREVDQATPARTSLKMAVRLAPDYAPAFRELGALELKHGEFKAAGAYLRKAGKLAPQDPSTQYALGTLYLKLKDRGRAIQHLQVVLRLARGTETARVAARLLRDIDEGPTRQPTSALDQVPPARRKQDQALIARTFGLSMDRSVMDLPDFLADLANEA